MPTSTKGAMTAELSTVSEAEMTSLAKGEYEVVGGGDTGGGVQARIICQPAGSSKFYSDTRLANGALQIDMTKEVQYT